MVQKEISFLFDEVKSLLNEDEFNKMIKFFEENPNSPESIRINSLRYDIEKYKEIAQSKGINFKPVQGNIPDAYYVTIPQEQRSWWNQERLWGKFYSQGNASLIPALFLFDKNDHEKMDTLAVLDMCAAPGSKSTQLGALMKNKGLLVANDYKSYRLYALHRNLQAFGIANVVVTQLDGRWIGERWPQSFDKILLDAPCSGTGSNRKNIFENRNEKSLLRYRRIQKKLLSSAIKALKNTPQSHIIYSTCSMLPLENEIVIQDFIMENLIEIVPLETSILDGWKLHSGLQEFKSEKLSSQFKNALRIYPHENDSDAFFIAKLKIKKEDNNGS